MKFEVDQNDDDDRRLRKEQKQNQIAPLVYQRQQDADQKFKEDTVAEALKKDKYSKKQKKLFRPKGWKSLESHRPGVASNSAASASEMGGHSHKHNHEDDGKSLRQIKQKSLSYNKLMLFLNENHPRKVIKEISHIDDMDSDDEEDAKKKREEEKKENEKTDEQKEKEMSRSDATFGVFDEIGSHCYCSCFSKQKITPMAHQIGLGSTLFLLATKAMSQFFFFLTLLNIPVYYFYHNANPVEHTNPAFLGFINSFSLGNIAQGRGSCSSLNIAQDNSIDLKCPSGSLENILYYGFTKENEATCLNIRSATKPESFFQEECYRQYEKASGEDSQAEMKRIEVLGKLEKYYYTNCFGKDSCKIQIDTGLDKLGIFDGGSAISSGGSTSTKDDKDKPDDSSNSGSKTDGKASSSDPAKPSSDSSSKPATKADPDSSIKPPTKPDSASSSSKDSKTKSDPSSSSSDPAKPSSGSSSNTTPAKAGGSRLLSQSIFGGTNQPTSSVDEIDMLSDLSPVCKSIVLGRVYQSKYTEQPIKDKIKNSKVEITSFKGILAPEPWLIFMAKCQQNTIVINQNGYTFNFKKEDLGIVVIFVDFAVILSFIYFVFFLNQKQDEYVDAFEEQTVEMSDFALEFSNIPSEEYYQGKETVLRAIMWERFQEIMRDQLEEDTGREQLAFDQNQLYNIIDITFASTDTVDIEHLQELKTLHDKLQKLQEEMEAADVLHEHNTDEEHTHKGKWDIFPCCPGARIDRVEKEFKETQKKYIHAKEHYLEFHDEKHSIKKTKDQIKGVEGKLGITKAYVTFKSMTALTLMQNAYQYSKIYRMTLNICKCCCQTRYQKMRLREFQGKWTHPRVPDLPDNIQWQNMGVLGWNKWSRSIFAWVVSILIIIVAFGAILVFKNLGKLNDESQFKLIPTKFCAKEADQTLVDMILEKSMAWLDYQKPKDEQKGLMSCYCYDKLKQYGYTNYSKLKNIDFPEYTENEKSPLCYEWYWTWVFSGTYKYVGSLFVLAINLAVPMTINALSHFQRLYTYNDQTMSTFFKVTFLSYFNVAVVVLLVNFELAVPVLNEGGILKGKYKDFSERWYANVGANICWTLFVMVFTPQISKLFVDPAKYAWKKWYDRGFKLHISIPKTHSHKDKSVHIVDDNDDLVYSNQLTQDNLNDIYLGPEIKAFFIYAQQFTSLWCIMTYSSGMPLLYPIGCLNFMVLYFVYKALLLKFYSKTKAFNQVLPQTSIHYFKFGIAFHVLVGMWVYSNSNVLSSRNTKSIEWFKQHIVEEKKYINIDKYPFMMRFVDGVGFLYFMFALLILGLIVFQMIATTVFSRLFRIVYLFLTCGGEKGRQEQLDQQEIDKQAMDDGEINSYSDDFILDLKLNPLKQFYNRSNKELENMEYIKKDYVDKMVLEKEKQKDMKKKNEHMTDKENQEFEEFREEHDRYFIICKKMKQRQHNFYQVFLSHIKVLVYETCKSSPIDENMLIRLSPDQQIEWIERNFATIQRSKKGRDSLRMEGICQSYNAKDSSLYRDLAFMQVLLENKDDALVQTHHHHHDNGHDHDKKIGEKDDQEKNLSMNGSNTGQQDSKVELIGIFKNDNDNHGSSMVQIKPMNFDANPKLLKGANTGAYGGKQSQIHPGSVDNSSTILIASQSQEVFASPEKVQIKPTEYGNDESDALNMQYGTGPGIDTIVPNHQQSILTPMSQGVTIADVNTDGNEDNFKDSPPINSLKMVDQNLG